jgi:predicted metallopeptidase
MKTKHWISILVLLLLALLIYLSTRPERKFEDYNFNNKNAVFNLAEPAYLDTIVQVGLDRMMLENVVVIIKNQTEAQSLGGEYETEAYIKTNGQQYVIWVKPGIKRSKAINTLAHELIHLQQYHAGWLRPLGGKSVIWKGDTIYDITEIEYPNRPWEADAFKHGPKLAANIKEVLWPAE